MINHPRHNIIATLSGKKILFLENGSHLEHQVNQFFKILADADLTPLVATEVHTLPLEHIASLINDADVIVFQTTWVHPSTTKLFEYISSLTEKKIIVECYLNNPTWYYARQHGSIHDVYIYSCAVYYDTIIDESESFYQLTESPYWDYENKFNK